MAYDSTLASSNQNLPCSLSPIGQVSFQTQALTRGPGCESLLQGMFVPCCSDGRPAGMWLISRNVPQLWKLRAELHGRLALRRGCNSCSPPVSPAGCLSAHPCATAHGPPKPSPSHSTPPVHVCLCLQTPSFIMGHVRSGPNDLMSI